MTNKPCFKVQSLETGNYTDAAHTLAVQHLTAKYGERVILRDVSLAVHSGEAVALCGPNGAGKSTLLSIMAGVADVLHPALRITAGAVTFDGVALPHNRDECARRISYMTQSESCAWDYTAEQVAIMGTYARTYGRYTADDRAQAVAALNKAGAAELSHRSVRTLSGGEWQRVRLARAIASNAPFYLLDEPCAGADMGYAHEIISTLDRITAAGAGALVIMHDINLAARSRRRIALLDSTGRMEAGCTADIMDAQKLSAVYGCDIAVAPSPAGGMMAYVK